MSVDVLFGGDGRHEGHVMERRHEDPAVEQIEADQTVELGVFAGLRLAS